MKHKLSDAQMKELKKAVIDKTPDQLKFDFALWSSKAIKEYVQREYGLSISRRTARRYMQKMGFTYQCPVKVAREQNPALVRKWLETDYPAIRKEAAESGSAIYWADESSVLTCETKARGHACGKEAPSDGKSPESGRRGAPVGEEERAGICQAAISQEGSASCR